MRTIIICRYAFLAVSHNENGFIDIPHYFLLLLFFFLEITVLLAYTHTHNLKSVKIMDEQKIWLISELAEFTRKLKNMAIVVFGRYLAQLLDYEGNHR